MSVRSMHGRAMSLLGWATNRTEAWPIHLPLTCRTMAARAQAERRRSQRRMPAVRGRTAAHSRAGATAMKEPAYRLDADVLEPRPLQQISKTVTRVAEIVVRLLMLLPFVRSYQ